MVRAIIFDLDGTLADTESLHFEAFSLTLAREGITLRRQDYFNRLIGYDDRDCLRVMMREHGKPADDAALGALLEAKAAIYQSMIAGRDVLFPGAAEFVRTCAQRFPLMMVTGTLRAEAQMILERCRLRPFFLDIIAAEDVEHGKPEPDGFVGALERLQFLLGQPPRITAKQCLVIEDTAAGVEAAHRAGMRVLALCQSASAAALAAAEIVRSSFLETDLDDVLGRL